ncbi:hypothetical protein [Streptomyces fuscigenes]|uniref:hypothetical protein n=1 Tax=Streptomyces fuscigenes TaxID=1528880 RepID=UPI001F1AD68E|nr:hypothetical protein [Streptomyces fuscigenes]MCF3960731.1 hypothetical protein [Streptomyces fuscigenes]
MLDTTPLTSPVDRFTDRLRAAPHSRLRRGPAAAALTLARELSARAQRLDDPGTEPRIMPDAGALLVADQLAVAVGDLVEALRTAPSQRELDEAVRSVARVVAEANL